MAFLVKNFDNLFFSAKICNYTNLRELISNMTIVFIKFKPQKIQISRFWSQIEVFLFFFKILQLDIFDGVDFQYGYSF